jgi:hypothetical protein
MRLFFLLMTLVLVIASLSGVILAYDGSYYLFQILDNAAPFSPHHRYINIPAQLPALVAMQFTDHLGVLTVAFGMGYLLLMLAPLLLAWWLVRDTAPHLFIWVVLGTTLVQLPFQALPWTETLTIVKLAFPLLLLIVLPPRRYTLPLSAALIIALVLTHPNAVLMLGFLAGVAALVLFLRPHERGLRLRQIALMLGAAALHAFAFAQLVSPYERNEATLDTALEHYHTVLLGLPMIYAIMIGLAGLLFFLQRRLKSRLLPFATMLLIAIGVVALAFTIAMPGFFRNVFNLRIFIAVFALPFMLLLVWEALASSEGTVAHSALAQQRLRVIQVAGVICVLFTLLQSGVWMSSVAAMEEERAANDAACLSSYALDMPRYPMLFHWSITPYTLLLQGRQPQQVVLFLEDCASYDFSEGMRVIPETLNLWESRWFDMTALRQRLALR